MRDDDSAFGTAQGPFRCPGGRFRLAVIGGTARDALAWSTR